MSEPNPPPVLLIEAFSKEENQSRHKEMGAMAASYLLMFAMLFLVMKQSLLPGLLCVCLGFLCTRSIGQRWGWFQSYRRGALKPHLVTPSRCGQLAAATLVILLPLVLVTMALSHSRSFVTHAPQQYREVLQHTAKTVLELRQKLPEEVGQHLPAGAADVQVIVANFLQSQAGVLALTGKAWLHALLFAYVGLVIGALAGCSRPPSSRHPLSAQLHQRICLFGESFEQIVAAQFWIAAFNMMLTFLFLMLVLPFWGMQVPYASALIALTFFAGLVPIVGNLLCNAVIVLVALSSSPATAATCLIFLILIHKAEYVINAKVVGSRMQMAVWELLAVMFLAEAVFGPAGLVAAPLFYAYVKKELAIKKLV